MQSHSNCFLNRQAMQARFKQALVSFWPPDIINFLLISLSIITSVQSKQICSFDDLETHTRSIVLVGVRLFSPFNSTTSKGNLRHQLQVTPLLILARNENENPSNETSQPLGTLPLASSKNGPTTSALNS